MTPSRIEELRRMASEWEFDKRIPAHRAARLLRELLGRVDELERGIGQMRLLAGLPLPPDVVAKLAEADRLRRLFDDAGQAIEITDFAPRFFRHGRMFRPAQLVRRVRPLQGHPRVRVVVDTAIGLLSPLCKGAGVKIVVEGRNDLRAFINTGKILQVITNLMMNALHAMPQGGTLTLRLERVEVESPKDKHAASGAFVKLSVTDTGVGIPPDSLQNIFEPFFTTKAEGQGTGLGLTVCHGIIRDHGGFMEVESQLDQGTTFYVYLPKTVEE